MNKYSAIEECYHCKYRRTLPWVLASLCLKPDHHMTGSRHGIANGWFMYPVNFDPMWKTKHCSNFEEM